MNQRIILLNRIWMIAWVALVSWAIINWIGAEYFWVFVPTVFLSLALLSDINDSPILLLYIPVVVVLMFVLTPLLYLYLVGYVLYELKGGSE